MLIVSRFQTCTCSTRSLQLLAYYMLSRAVVFTRNSFTFHSLSRTSLNHLHARLPISTSTSTSTSLPFSSFSPKMDHAPLPSCSAAFTETAPPRDKLQVTSHNQYKTPRVTSNTVNRNPLEQFRLWLSSALNPQPTAEFTTPVAVHEPEAMTLSTSLISTDPRTGKPIALPSSRVVLLKQVDSRGFVFYTNYTSRKSQELISNPYASIAFYWREVSRSVRVVGVVEQVSRAESEEYFATRPRGSQIGAWASEQSKEVGEEVLEERVREEEKRWEGKEVQCPPHWGGWRVVPL